MAFVHEDQIVALERFHRHAQAAALLHFRELGDLDHAHGAFVPLFPHAAFAQVEAAAGNGGIGHVRQMLLAQALVGSDQQDAVQRAAMPGVVVQELVVVEVQQQRLAAAGSDPERQLAQIVSRVFQIHAHIALPGIRAVQQLEVVEGVQQGARAGEEPVQIDLGVERGQVLEVAQGDGGAASGR